MLCCIIGWLGDVLRDSEHYRYMGELLNLSAIMHPIKQSLCACTTETMQQ